MVIHGFHAFHWRRQQLSHFNASITANADPELAVAPTEVTLLYPFWAAPAADSGVHLLDEIILVGHHVSTVLSSFL